MAWPVTETHRAMDLALDTKVFARLVALAIGCASVCRPPNNMGRIGRLTREFRVEILFRDPCTRVQRS